MTAIANNMPNISLTKLLFAEKRSQAIGLIQQLENGFMLTRNGQRLQLSQLTADQFLKSFAINFNMELAMESGYFSTVLIDLGAGEIECVIKFGHRLPYVPGGYVPSADEDSFWDFAMAAKKYGGQNFATPLPNIYYLSTLKLAGGFQLPVCIMEYVTLDARQDARKISTMTKEAMHAVVHSNVEEYKKEITASDNSSELLENYGWSLDDLLKFAKVLVEVTGGKIKIDIHGENVGRRSDGSVCVFDPVA